MVHRLPTSRVRELYRNGRFTAGPPTLVGDNAPPNTALPAPAPPAAALPTFYELSPRPASDTAVRELSVIRIGQDAKLYVICQMEMSRRSEAR